MSATINRVFLAGHLTRNPEVKFLANEKAVANFGLAINHRWKNADGTPREEVVFVDVEAWGRTGELVGQYLTKGSSCIIEGRLKLDTWEKDGQKHSKLKVQADNVQFLDRKDKDGEGPHQSQPPRAATAPAKVRPESIEDTQPPF
jgi:single-strand DNA-binding protein